MQTPQSETNSSITNESLRVSTTPVQQGVELAEQAQLMAHRGQYDKALDVLDAAIILTPQASEVWYAKMQLLFELGRSEDAENILMIALEQLDVQATISLGKRSLSVWRPELAIKCSERALQNNPESSSAHVLYGDSLLELGRWEAAFAAFIEAEKHASRKFGATKWSARGDRFLVYEQTDLALKAFTRAIELDPSNPEGWHGKATVLKKQGNLDGALDAFEHASAISEQFIAGFLEAGEICLDRVDFDRALNFFLQAKDAQPEDPRPWASIGWVHALSGRHDEARIAYERATNLDPENASIWNALGNSLFYLGQEEEARRTIERAIEIDPNFSWAHQNLAWILFSLKQPDEAIEAMNKAVELEPGNGTFLVSRMKLMESAGKIGDAEIEAEADRALEAAGADSTLQVHVGSILADYGRIERARDLLQTIQPTAVKDEATRLDYAEYLLKIGAAVEAVEALGSIDQTKLSHPMHIGWSFLHVLADRLAGAPRVSNTLLEDFLNKVASRHHSCTMNPEWSYAGLRRLLARCELPLADKLALATLTDVVEAKVDRNDLSFFEDIWKPSGEDKHA